MKSNGNLETTTPSEADYQKIRPIRPIGPIRPSNRPAAARHFCIETPASMIRNNAMKTSALLFLLVAAQVQATTSTQSSAVTSPPASTAYDTIIRNGRIIDGTGNPWFRGDVGISQGKIAAIGILPPGATASQVIAAEDRYVSPGFIDVHTHCEGDLTSSPGNLAENFVRMGVTSVVTGNCGGSYLNLADAVTTFAKTGLGLNVASLVGHNTVRRNVMGNAWRDPSTTEVEAMQKLVEQAMKDGAVGMSTGLIYNPGVFSKTPEIAALNKIVGRYNGVYASHMRSEGNTITSAIDEALTIGLQGNTPVQISHFKITAPKLHGQSTRTVAMVENARAAGLDVTVDQYLYTASSTGINTMLPEWASEGTTEVVRGRLADPVTRKKIRDEIIKDRRDDAGRPDMSYARVAGFRADNSINGLNLVQVAQKWRNDTSWDSQVDVALDMITSGGAGMVYHSIAENDVRNIASYPNTMFASDSGVRTFGSGVPHPRGYGNNARALGKYVRDEKLLRLEEAVRKMSSLPAQRFRFLDRGVLRPGMAADVVVFDLERVNDPATFEQPHAYAEGFDHVLVNGTPVIADGTLTQKTPGQFLPGPGKSR